MGEGPGFGASPWAVPKAMAGPPSVWPTKVRLPVQVTVDFMGFS